MTSKTTISFINPLFGLQSSVSCDQHTSGSSTAQWVQLQDQRQPPPGTPTGNDPKTTDSSLQKQLALLTLELQNLHQTLLYFQNNYITHKHGFKTPSIQSPLSTSPTISNHQSDTPSSCSQRAHQQQEEEDAIDKLLADVEHTDNTTSNSTHSLSSPSCSTSSMQSEDLDATYTLPTKLPTLYIPPLSHHQRRSFSNYDTNEGNISSKRSSTASTCNYSSRRRRNLPPPPPALVPAKPGSQLDDDAVLLKMT
jgi:hypothetical protein